MAPKDTFFRSVDMSLIQLYMANENGHEVVRALASLTSEIDELVERTECLEQQISSLNDSYETLMKRELELTEWAISKPGATLTMLTDQGKRSASRLIMMKRVSHPTLNNRLAWTMMLRASRGPRI
ncbi:H(+)-transporting V0 sector ATPase subunit a [Aspergillus puulaauensis]|uniref:H(+)-transporting V0 sector ATPase subunit a n=1 Tax=Aspergillus puulaauensis TaxID=1220207 RepID=A0A7R7Y0G3_9EURO|nr:H(+)-transporting V0 sector ATPase subunit a [Aspergillus puulaauensis]BCS30198.1 H(+)-transporting V0 sector ATPase subunit a [Aspergillus puulaauensis]